MKQLLIVGCGLTGASLARFIHEAYPGVWKITLWESLSRQGGRFFTCSQGSKTNSVSIDLGAQYVSATPQHYSIFKSIYTELETEGALTPMQPRTLALANPPDSPEGSRHWIAPRGMRSLVRTFLARAGDPKVELNHKVTQLHKVEGKWHASTDKGSQGIFDSVVVTCPVPDFLQIGGDIPSILTDRVCGSLKSKLEAVTYSTRFALGLFYPSGNVFTPRVPWTIRYIRDESPCICFISINNHSDQTNSSDEVDEKRPFAICAHTSVPFGLKHIDASLEEVQPIIEKHVTEVLPELPNPEVAICHQWRYSQVYRGFLDSIGCEAVTSEPALILAGDAFTSSGFNGCLLSAQATCQQLEVLS